MKKIIVLSTAFLLLTAVSFAHGGHKGCCKHSSSKCCKHESSKCCHHGHDTKGGVKKEGDVKKDGK